RRCNDDRILHSAVVFERLHHLRHSRALLPDGDIDTNNARFLLIDDRVERDRRLTRLAVADDQFALSPADGNHRVDGLDSGLQRLLHRLPVHHAWRDALDVDKVLGGDGSFAIDRLAERIDHAPDHRIAYWHGHDAARAADLVAFFDTGV